MNEMFEDHLPVGTVPQVNLDAFDLYTLIVGTLMHLFQLPVS